MSDINLLGTDDQAHDDKDKSSKPVQDDEMPLHVPKREPEEKPVSSTPAGSFLSRLIETDQAASVPTEKLFSQKIEPISAAPSQPVPKPAVAIAPLKVPVPLKAIAPSSQPLRAVVPPPPPPQKPSAPSKPEPEGKEDRTLRVSLITGNGGSGFSDLALRRRQRTFAVIGLLGLAIDAAIFGGLHLRKLMIEKRNVEAEKAVQDIDARIAARESEIAPARDFQALTKAAARVLDAHAHWTEVLALLEARALPDVQFGSLAGAETGTLGFEVTARDYTTLAKQIVAFRQDPRVKNVAVGTASADVGENELLKGVHASMSLEIDPAIFRYRPPTASVEAGGATL